MVDYSIVIPAYNEEAGISASLTKVINFMKSFSNSFEVIVVDDGSTDKTSEIVQNYIDTHPELHPSSIGSSYSAKLIRNPHKGKGATVRKGVLDSSGNYILFSDADMATPIDEIKRMMVWIQEHDYDVVIASRQGKGAKRKNEPFLRHLMGRVFNTFVRFMVLPGIQDTQCGFKLMKGDVARNVFSKMILFGDSAPEIKVPKVSAFDIEMLVISKRLKCKIKEVPVTWTYVPTTRVSPVRDSIDMFLDVVKVKLNDISGKYN